MDKTNKSSSGFYGCNRHKMNGPSMYKAGTEFDFPTIHLLLKKSENIKNSENLNTKHYLD